MVYSVLLAVLAVTAIPAFVFGYRNALAVANGDPSSLHSRPVYHGSYVAIWTILPAILLVTVWAALAPAVIGRLVRSELPEATRQLPPGEVKLIMDTAWSVAAGLPRLKDAERTDIRLHPDGAKAILGQAGVSLATDPQPLIISAAERLIEFQAVSHGGMIALAILMPLGMFMLILKRMDRKLRARNAVEQIMHMGLIAASTIAVLTTVGIVLSVLVESIQFFSKVSLFDFLTGTVWDPRGLAGGQTGNGGGGQFGLLPLLWGTIFISAIALLVAVPLGLFAAIFMAEYAHHRVRAILKPVLEVLAGIPTIVYGFFAIATVGPFLRDAGETFGMEIAATSALSAGIVMGIMIIPFISSLSDDIIGAVPRSLREGSFGLGATKSETIKLVVLPAALPGIVGAVLLAASRAIGETMIVVLAAGIDARLTLNPFQQVTTMTVKIVSQLTGDLQFNTPQTLVAFALGLTLFIITLGLNIYALHIVRKYREQYE